MESGIDGYFVLSFLKQAHNTSVTTLATSTNHLNSRFASGSSDSTCKLWKLKNQGCCSSTDARSLTYCLSDVKAAVQCVCISIDETLLISGSSDGYIRIWSTSVKGSFNSFRGHEGAVNGICCCSNSDMLSAGFDKSVKLWSLTSMRFQQSFIGHTNSVRSVCFYHPQLIVSCGVDRTVKLWHKCQRTCVSTLTGSTSSLNSVKFSGDGNFVSASASDGSVFVWDVRCLKLFQTFLDCEGPVLSHAFHPRQNLIAATSADKSLKFLSIDEGRCVGTIKSLWDVAAAVTFSCSGDQLLAGDLSGNIIIWQKSSKQKLSQ